MIRSVQLARIALEAEALRLKRMAKRTSMRLVLALAAVPFLMAMLALLRGCTLELCRQPAHRAVCRADPGRRQYCDRHDPASGCGDGIRFTRGDRGTESASARNGGRWPTANARGDGRPRNAISDGPSYSAAFEAVKRSGCPVDSARGRPPNPRVQSLFSRSKLSALLTGRRLLDGAGHGNEKHADIPT